MAPTPAQEALAQVAREIQRDDTQRDIAQAAGINQATWHNCLRGLPVSFETAVKVAENLHLAPALRARWFTATGHADPREQWEEEMGLEETTVEALRGVGTAPREDLLELNRMLQGQIRRWREERGLP